MFSRLRQRAVVAVAGVSVPSLTTRPLSSSLRSITCPMWGRMIGS
jgi:hypothetical protein